MFFLIITIIDYLSKRGEDQETIKIIISFLIITIINCCKKIREEKN